MKQKKEDSKVYSLIFRYIILVLLALGNLWLFYFIFTPLTVYSVFILLNLFFPVALSGITINFNGISIQLIKACIAGSAYYLLLILNLTTPLKLKTRVLSILFSVLSLLIINIIRIFIFSIILIESFSFFNTAHMIFWYFLSSLIVFGIWLLTIKIYEIREIPVYSDIKFLYSKIKKKSK